MDDLRVRVVKRTGRRFYQAEWNDPTTGELKTKSTRKTRKDEARDVARGIRDRILAGTYTNASLPWDRFCELYLDEVSLDLAEKSVRSIVATFNAVRDLINPRTLQVMATAPMVREFASKLRQRRKKNGKPFSPASVNCRLRTLKAALRWAENAGLLDRCPRFPKLTQREVGAKARPITGEEFDRLTQAVPTVVPESQVDAWQRLLRGLWLSGLRIGEALRLSWDAEPVILELDRATPVIRFGADGQKNRKSELCPITPEFVAFLNETPEGRRSGLVFPLPTTRADNASKTLVQVGKAARIKTAANKWASAHDLRRAFAVRMATRVPAALLCRMMRHRSMQTTMAFYVGQEVDELASVLWKTDTFTDTSPVSRSSRPATIDASSSAQSTF